MLMLPGALLGIVVVVVDGGAGGVMPLVIVPPPPHPVATSNRSNSGSDAGAMAENHIWRLLQRMFNPSFDVNFP